MKTLSKDYKMIKGQSEQDCDEDCIKCLKIKQNFIPAIHKWEKQSNLK